MTRLSISVPLRPAANRVAVATVLGSTVLVVFDTAAVSMALPMLGDDLDASPAATIRIVTAYQAALLMALLPSAAIGARFGLRSVFATGVALFTVASVACVAARSLEMLVIARAIQGLGAAAILSLAVALLRQFLPPDRFASAIAWNATAVALATAAAPTLGALIISAGGWRWLFLANLPVGAAVLTATGSLPRAERSGGELDLISMGLNALLFGSFIAGVEAMQHEPAASAVLALASILALALLIRRELPKMTPLLPIDLLRHHSFRTSVLASVCCFAGQTTGLLALPFHLQHGFGQPIWMVGICMTPWPLAVALAAPISGRLADRLSSARLCGVGAASLAAGLAIDALSPLSAGILPLIAGGIVSGLGWSLFQVANNRSMFLAAPLERSAAAGGLQGTARLLGQTLGALLLTQLFTWTNGDAAPRLGLAFGALLTIAAATVSWRSARIRS